MSTAERLYTPELLAWAVKLAEYPLAGDLPLRGDARSPSCGSTLSFACETDESGRIGKLGLRVAACAVGQASAAIFAASAPGKDRTELEESLAAIEAWLGGEGAMPDWPQLDAIAAAQAYPARHGAILLPWKAALAALSKRSGAG